MTTIHTLVVEDESVSRTVVQAVIQTEGYQVSLARNGAEAWASWQKDKPRLIVSDWMMPLMDGLELCRRIRAQPSESYTYFILLTGKTGKENFLQAMAAGIDDFMAKPVDAAELKARIHVAERILGLRRELQLLEGLLPICSYCKKIRNEGKDWQPIERYVRDRADVEFSHGICPDCYAKHVQPQIDALPRR